MERHWAVGDMITLTDIDEYSRRWPHMKQDSGLSMVSESKHSRWLTHILEIELQIACPRSHLFGSGKSISFDMLLRRANTRRYM